MAQALVFKPLRDGTSLSFYDYSSIEATCMVACCIEKGGTSVYGISGNCILLC